LDIKDAPHDLSVASQMQNERCNDEMKTETSEAFAFFFLLNRKTFEPQFAGV
jgi:hypothetical protein